MGLRSLALRRSVGPGIGRGCVLAIWASMDQVVGLHGPVARLGVLLVMGLLRWAILVVGLFRVVLNRVVGLLVLVLVVLASDAVSSWVEARLVVVSVPVAHLAVLLVMGLLRWAILVVGLVWVVLKRVASLLILVVVMFATGTVSLRVRVRLVAFDANRLHGLLRGPVVGLLVPVRFPAADHVMRLCEDAHPALRRSRLCTPKWRCGFVGVGATTASLYLALAGCHAAVSRGSHGGGSGKMHTAQS